MISLRKSCCSGVIIIYCSVRGYVHVCHLVLYAHVSCDLLFFSQQERREREEMKALQDQAYEESLARDRVKVSCCFLVIV